MSEESSQSTAVAPQPLDLVHEGWCHLQHQRPQAAWASWHRALRQDPGFTAARQALERLAAARELPAAARAVHRFRAPADAAARARWDERLPARGTEDLNDAAAAFALLAALDPTDAAAAHNEGLCLAWLGRNAAAIAALDRAVRLTAATDFQAAVEAWTLAEVLRQGGGAEALADDLSYAWIITPVGPETVARLARYVPLVPMPAPGDPITGPLHAGAQVFEWRDRPTPGKDAIDLTADLPRVLATLVQAAHALRLSSPDPGSLDALAETLARLLGPDTHSIRREAQPLPLTLLDAAVWTIRLPQGLAPESQHALTRTAVESFYEDRWIHWPRQGLNGLTPLEAAARAAATADAVIRARLTAVVRLREQLAGRPLTAALYQGYPFDRLRRRLGLELIDPAAVDADDLTCASPAELARLDPAALEDSRLAEAFESAAGLGDQTRTAVFAAALAGRPGPAPRLSRLGLCDLFAPLVRQEMNAGRPEAALAWLDRARVLVPGPSRARRTFDVWRAEVHARSGAADAALQTYQALLGADPFDPLLALDGAETLFDNGFQEQGLALLRRARDHALQSGDPILAEHAQALINAH